MVTSDPRANITAAVHVAHSLSVHEEESESDYFTVVDDLQDPGEDAGAAHIGDTELTSGIFYGYTVIDLPTLVSNLEGCPEEEWRNADLTLASETVEHLIHLIATVTPGAKLGSTAPYTYADLMLVEAGDDQPRSLAGAFREDVPPQKQAAIKALSNHLQDLDQAYGGSQERRAMTVGPHKMPGTPELDLKGIAAWAAQTVRDQKI